MSTSGQQMLPELGSKTACSCNATNVEIEMIGLGTLKLSFKGGITLLSESPMGDGFEGVKQRVIDHEVSADSSQVGKIVIRHAQRETTPLGTLHLVSRAPLTYRHVLCLDCQITVSKPPGGGPPMQLMNPKTAVLINDHLGKYPPQAAVYRLREAVDLALAVDPSQVAARLLPFAVTISSASTPSS